MVISISGLASKKLLVFVFFLFLTGMIFGIDKEDIKVTAPTFKSNSGIDVTELDNAAAEAFNDLRNTLYENLYFLPDNLNKLAGAFANASVLSSDGASQRGYEGYNAFSFTVGFMGALKFPRNFMILDQIKNIANGGEGEFDFIKDNMDVGIGLDLQILNAQFGINVSKFLLEGLYLGFKFSKFDTDLIKVLPLSGFSFKTMSIGANASYQLISQKRILAGLFVWRGLNLGTGFIWQNTSVGLALPLSEELEDVTIPISLFEDISMPLNGAIGLGFEMNTYIVPIEAMTSVRLLGFLNVALGAGIDVAFGSSSINAYGSFNVDKDKVNNDLPPGVTMDRAPSLELNLGGKSGPSIFNIKTMGAVGFNFGPFIIDIPVTWYFLDNGYSLGFTLGFSL